jgi:hypothetical protein
MASVSARYGVDDVDAAVDFYFPGLDEVVALVGV